MRIFSLLLLIGLLSLSACYRPLYGEKSFGEKSNAREGKLNNIAIASIPNQNGQKLRNLLIDRFYNEGRPTKPGQELRIILTASEQELGTQKNATNTRARVELSANSELVDLTTGKRLWNANIRSIVSYDILDEQYATLAAKENTYDRAIRELSDMITTRLLLFISSGVAAVPAVVTPPAPPPVSIRGSNALSPTELTPTGTSHIGVAPTTQPGTVPATTVPPGPAAVSP